MQSRHLKSSWVKNQTSKQVSSFDDKCSFTRFLPQSTHTALNLVLCYFAVNDRDKMKKTFRQMLDISSGAEDEDRYYPAVVSRCNQHISHSIHCNLCPRMVIPTSVW